MHHLTWKNDRGFQVATSLLVINVHIRLWELVNLHATLVVIDAAPDENLAGLGAGDGVVSAAIDLSDAVRAESLNQGGNEDSVVFVLGCGDAGLAEGIETPSIQLAIFVDCKAVVVARSNLCDLLSLQTELARNQSTLCGPGHNPTCKLILLTSTPDKDLALVIESENVIGTTAKSDDFLELRDEDWGALEGFAA